MAIIVDVIMDLACQRQEIGEVSDFMSHRELILRFILCLEFPPAWRTHTGAEGSATVQANTVVVDVYLDVYLYNSGTFEGPEGDPIYIWQNNHNELS